MKRKKPLRRRTGLSRVNVARREKERARQFGELAAFVRSFRCCVPGCPGRPEAAHVRTRRNHGAWMTLPDGRTVGNLVPMCRKHHTEQHTSGIQTFQRKYDLDLAQIAAGIGTVFKMEHEQ